MDTKWKNNRILRKIGVVYVLIVITVGNLYFFPHMVNQAKILRQEERLKEASESELDTYSLELLYYGTHVLYKDALLEDSRRVLKGTNEVSAKDTNSATTHIVEEDGVDYIITNEYIVEEIITERNYKEQEYIENFYNNNQLDYCVLRPDENGKYTIDAWNGTNDLVSKLEQLQYEESNSTLEKELQSLYDFYAILAFDEEGQISIPKLYDKNFSTEVIERELLNTEKLAWKQFGENEYQAFPRNIKIVYAIDQEHYQLRNDSWWNEVGVYYNMNVVILPILSLAFIILFALLLRSPKPREGKKESLFMRYPLIPIAFGVYLCGTVIAEFPYWINEYEWILEDLKMYQNDSYFIGFILSAEELKMLTTLGYFLLLFVVYAVAYYTVALIRPVFKLGIVSYVKEKSIIISVILKIKYYIGNWKEELKQVHMEKEKKKKLVTILLVNFIILSILSVFWFFAIPIFLIYTILLYFYLQKAYSKIEKDYQVMAQATEEIAKGHLEYEMKESMGIYEPMREKLGRVQDGMQKAVREEVKSQRMKTELISNVSHDLKTPLTAITTYVELLKNPHLTQEEREGYIETLENKSLRLKTLIEDLFEVSKTASHDIVLNKAEVDIVHLLKQAAVEQQEKWETLGLTIRYQIPEEKVCLFLDGQKTYRIFDNLFGNISKYAMPNTRVYLEVRKQEGTVSIVLRNISAVELTVTPEEITERFVRGDASRNTEGSGLGLAIAKNLVEVQDGIMEIALDGDLFKVMICWQLPKN